jgi:flagellar FliL protein
MTSAIKQEQRFATNSGSPATAKGPGGKPTKDGDGGGAATAKPKIYKSKKFILALVGLLVVGYGAYTFLAPTPKPGAPAGGEYVPVSTDPLTLNLAGGHYLKVAISLQLVAGKAKAADFALTTAKAASLAITEFSDRTVESLSSDTARKKLTDDLLKQLQKAYPDEVFAVFLTQFVTQ